MDDKIDLKVFVDLARPLAVILETELAFGNMISDVRRDWRSPGCIRITMTHPHSAATVLPERPHVVIKLVNKPQPMIEFIHEPSGHILACPLIPTLPNH